jgi:hypothetical protein
MRRAAIRRISGGLVRTGNLRLVACFRRIISVCCGRVVWAGCKCCIARCGGCQRMPRQGQSIREVRHGRVTRGAFKGKQHLLDSLNVSIDYYICRIVACDFACLPHLPTVAPALHRQPKKKITSDACDVLCFHAFIQTPAMIVSNV